MRLPLFLLCSIAVVGWANAQTLPEFPALDSDVMASASGLPDMPAMDEEPMGSSDAASLPDMPSLGSEPEPLPGGDMAALPDLQLPPMNGNAVATPPPSPAMPDLPPPSGGMRKAPSAGLPDLPDVEKPKEAPSVLPALPVQGPAPSVAPSGLPSLPGDMPSVSPAPAAPAAQPALPSLPGEAPATASDKKPALPALPALPGEAPAGQAAAPAPPVVTTAAAGEKPAVKKFVYVPPARHPNTIFGGLVTPKGSGEEMHLAWSSQEVLNAMLGNRYELLKETGEYNPGGWREFTFQQAKTKRVVSVYVRSVGKRVWMRVGPSEPPAGVSLKEAVQVRKDSEAALKILKKKFGAHLTPKRGTWEAPFDRPVS